jgi:hypothetical protein
MLRSYLATNLFASLKENLFHKKFEMMYMC